MDINYTHKIYCNQVKCSYGLYISKTIKIFVNELLEEPMAETVAPASDRMFEVIENNDSASTNTW